MMEVFVVGVKLDNLSHTESSFSYKERSILANSDQVNVSSCFFDKSSAPIADCVGFIELRVLKTHNLKFTAVNSFHMQNFTLSCS